VTVSLATRSTSESKVERATWTVFSSIPRARSENQNSSPLWNNKDAKIATSTVGTAAITENKATRRVCRRPLPSPPCSARLIAIRREYRTISTIAGIRFATSNSPINGGESNDPGCAPRLNSQALKTAMATSTTPVV